MATIVQPMQSSTLVSQPQSPATTAPVREHACLFTHDLRRKQKRWQDGRLKYHTFNRRVMVYDERGGFIGDTHWREDYDLADGDDLELERGGIIIQVGECVGSRDQDLSELIDKRAQERALRQAAAAARQPPIASVATLPVVKSQSLPLKHLHSVIGAPSGHHGRAVIPKESPYEERRQRQAAPQSDDTRPAKRQKIGVSPPSKSGYAQNLFGATLTLSGRPSSQALTRPRRPRLLPTREALTSPPSSSVNEHNDPVMDMAQTPIDLQNAQGSSSEQRSVGGHHASTSMNAFNGLRSSKKPDLPPHLNSELTDQLGRTPTPRQQHSKSRIEAGEDSTGKCYGPNSRPVNQNLRKSGEVDASLEQAGSKSHESNELPAVEMSKKIREKRSGTSNGEIQRHTSTLQNSNTVNLDEDGAEVSHKQPTPDEARTELRIKPRKKRGLLMVSERNSVGGSSSKSVAMKAGPSTNNCISSSETRAADASRGKGTEKEAFTSAENNWTVSGTEVARTASQRKQTNRDVEDYEGCHPSSHIDNSRHPGEDDGLDKTRCLGRPSAKARRVAKPKPAVEHVDNHATEPYVVETMRRLRPNRQLSSKVAVVSNGFGEVPGRSNLERREHNVVVDKMPAPRLAKLGRKSIRSREVIGFIFDEEQDPIFSVRRALDLQPDQPNGELPCQPSIVVDHAISAPKAHPEAESGRRSHDLREAKGPTALQRQNSRTSKPLDNEASPLNHNEEISSTVTTATVTKQPVTRIANPATRGKRAAKPSDAAGQMPTCPLATEPPGRSSVHQNPSMTDVPGSLSKGTAGPMPGFIRANGGPWSREAHDLFDFKRPL